jgi:hypothetical protein
MEIKTTKPGKNEFKCFHCRKVFAKRDGDWFHWSGMEVHLCRLCDRSTAQKQERGK